MMFWFSIGLLTLVVAFICFYPLLKQAKKNNQMVAREALNKAFYFDRLKELEQDQAQGLIDNAEQLKTELQQSLLQDIPSEQNAKDTANHESKLLGKIWFLSGFLTLAVLAGASYFHLGAWQAQDMLTKTYDKLPYFYERLKEEDSKPLTEQEMQQFSTALRLKVQHEPQDAASWFMLGQLGMAMDNGQLALDSYAKAHQLDSANHHYKLAYARILMFSEDQRDKTQGEELLKQVIRQDHSNMEALSLLAFSYFEREDYKMAIVSWEMMLKLMAADDSRRGLVEKSITSARTALAEQNESQKEAIAPK
ncbi:c-type cytochrome biogenesis protein CcmI [Pasteurellaceae bacterium Pebbles2]|nr:c-type cytochrome biogenesis protein CcmI [Pasteurellaceae bacterium Pebbles2]